MTRLNMRGYSDKIIDNNLLEVKKGSQKNITVFSLNSKNILMGYGFLWLLSEIVIVYIIKDLSTCVIY